MIHSPCFPRVSLWWPKSLKSTKKERGFCLVFGCPTVTMVIRMLELISWKTISKNIKIYWTEWQPTRVCFALTCHGQRILYLKQYHTSPLRVLFDFYSLFNLQLSLLLNKPCDKCYFKFMRCCFKSCCNVVHFYSRRHVWTRLSNNRFCGSYSNYKCEW